MCVSACGTSPGLSGEPCMVKVLPAFVTPYAITTADGCRCCNKSSTCSKAHNTASLSVVAQCRRPCVLRLLGLLLWLKPLKRLLPLLLTLVVQGDSVRKHVHKKTCAARLCTVPAANCDNLHRA